jgi:hypothetical protein
VGVSKQNIIKLTNDLESFVGDREIVFEMYRELPEDLEPRTNILKGRIAIYHDAESEIIKIEAEKPADSRQQYGVDISIVRGYRGDDATNSELIALDLRDKVIEWVKQLDAHLVTDGGMSSIGYDGSTGFTRRKRYITITLRLTGQRDLILTQSEE